MSGENDELETKRIITWKDADQNLCYLACSLLDAADNIRSSAIMTQPKAVDGDGDFEPGFVEKNPESSRGWWSVGWQEQDCLDWDILSAIGAAPEYPCLCWYSFQQLVRFRLAQARAELARNLFKQSRALRSDKGASRNQKTRSKWFSKFNRAKERPQD